MHYDRASSGHFIIHTFLMSYLILVLLPYLRKQLWIMFRILKHIDKLINWLTISLADCRYKTRLATPAWVRYRQKEEWQDDEISMFHTESRSPCFLVFYIQDKTFNTVYKEYKVRLSIHFTLYVCKVWIFIKSA